MNTWLAPVFIGGFPPDPLYYGSARKKARQSNPARAEHRHSSGHRPLPLCVRKRQDFMFSWLKAPGLRHGVVRHSRGSHSAKSAKVHIQARPISAHSLKQLRHERQRRKKLFSPTLPRRSREKSAIETNKRKFLETLVSKRRFGHFAAVGKVTRRLSGETILSGRLLAAQYGPSDNLNLHRSNPPKIPNQGP